MKHNINPMKVEMAVKDTLRSLGNGGLAHGEVLLALSESLGRMIVEVCKTPVQMTEMAKIANNHLLTTIHVGAQAKGFRGVEREVQQ